MSPREACLLPTHLKRGLVGCAGGRACSRACSCIHLRSFQSSFIQGQALLFPSRQAPIQHAYAAHSTCISAQGWTAGLLNGPLQPCSAVQLPSPCTSCMAHDMLPCHAL